MARQFPAALAIAVAVGLVAPAPCAAQAPSARRARTGRHAVDQSRRPGVSPTSRFSKRPRSRTPTATRSTLSAFQIGRSYINVTGNITQEHLVPRHARHRARDRRRQLAERQLHVPAEIRLRAVEPRGPPGQGHPMRGSACSRRRGSSSSTPSTATASRGRRSRIAKASCPVRRRRVVPLRPAGRLRRRAGGGVQRRDLRACPRSTIRRACRSAARCGRRPATPCCADCGHGVLGSRRLCEERRPPRAIVAVTFEHPHVHAGFDYLTAKTGRRRRRTAIEGRGWSAFVTPRTSQGLGGAPALRSAAAGQDR